MVIDRRIEGISFKPHRRLDEKCARLKQSDNENGLLELLESVRILDRGGLHDYKAFETVHTIAASGVGDPYFTTVKKNSSLTFFI